MMIKASDLRIGNIVECLDEVYTVNGVPDGNTVLLYGWPYKEPPVNISPVTITEDWLMKFGFELDENGHYVFECGRKAFRINVQEGDNILCYRDDVGLDWCSLSEVLYIHHLQNLYYALTGEELQIK